MTDDPVRLVEEVVDRRVDHKLGELSMSITVDNTQAIEAIDATIDRVNRLKLKVNELNGVFAAWIGIAFTAGAVLGALIGEVLRG